jgi:hypothetical protein
MKMPMFDARGRPIGILVMEIPGTSASSEQDAAHQAEAIVCGEIVDRLALLVAMRQ